MAKHALLNNVEHKDLKIATHHSESFGDNMMCVPLFPVEVRHAQAHYPILFVRDGEGQFQMVALLGFEQHENLFLRDQQWQAAYKPLLIEKGPFLIGRNPQAGNATLSIHIDLDDPRVNTEQGEALFLPHGGNSDYIENIANVLSTIHQSQSELRQFISVLERLELIESFVVDIELDGQGTHRLSGFFTLNEDKIKALDAETLGRLHQDGYLELVYMIVASMSQLRALVERKKARMAV
ncbi:hypothetical protein DXV75_07355 [Alteromonas aestuariivivens]|uniref:Multidrug transporter n=1 Tax=Alteromonas aestuariivivens TaxID=1938339 RepID=A0A3D8M9V1_9ALTE|nr:SapC family protein [Alteromonas aestuariivivens]RDV26797.1 hypothetical protein DXV75_07355 [Alteromonas aestuariivivens]